MLCRRRLHPLDTPRHPKYEVGKTPGQRWNRRAALTCFNPCEFDSIMVYGHPEIAANIAVMAVYS